MLVVKVGGAAGIDLDAVCDDLATLVGEGRPWVLVHGGSHLTNVIAEKLGYPPRFLTSVSGFTSRYTDAETLEIFKMVYCGKVNKGIVERLQARGVNAVGLSGLDGRLLEGRRKGALKVKEGERTLVVRDDLTGTVEKVNAPLLRALLREGLHPVICPPAITPDGQAINVDGDRTAARIAAALGASVLVILSAVPGLLREFPDESTLIERLTAPEAREAVERHAQGRMRIKVLGCLEAIEAGVERVIVADGRIPQPVRRALEGRGTTIVPGE